MILKTIALFMNHPECSRQCVSGMIEALRSDYKIKIVSNEFFTDENLQGIDIVAFPGGIGDADSYYDFFKRRHGNVVANFVANGGAYLGICMGAYWAGSNYFDILNGVEPVQYIKQPNADIKRPYATVANVVWLDSHEQMFFYDGCCFENRGGSYQVWGDYSHHEPMAIKQGRVGLIGCHPESMRHWYKKQYMKEYWHEGEHNDLLNGFVDRLMKN